MYKYVLICCATQMVIDMEAYFEKLPKHAPLPPQKFLEGYVRLRNTSSAREQPQCQESRIEAVQNRSHSESKQFRVEAVQNRVGSKSKAIIVDGNVLFDQFLSEGGMYM